MFHPPPAEVAITCVRGVCSGAAPEDGLTDVQASVIAAVAAQAYATVVDPRALVPIGPEELAAAVADVGLRHQMVVGMLGLSLMAHPPDPEGPERIASYARALGVEEAMMAATRRYVEGHRRWMLLDVARHSVLRTLAERQVRDRGLAVLLEQAAAVEGVAEDRALAARFQALQSCPSGSWGRALWEFYQAMGWPFPGQPGAVPQVTAEHDWVHVLSGYPPTPMGEIQVTAFMAANMRDDLASSILFFALGIYETGAIHVPLAPSHVGTMTTVPDASSQFADALRRGGACRVDTLLMDHWAEAERPLAEVREELGVGPKHRPGEDPVPSVPTLVWPAAQG